MRWLTRAPELRNALVVSWALVLARSLVYALFEHAHFDSDQAIVGLMAKHLSEGRAFPLFFYGQSYMLAVEAWWAVPFFWIGGATVAALRASLIVTNLAVVSMLIVGLHRWGGLRPYLALVAALFIVLPSPETSAALVEAQGGNIEPFFWILVVWFVRERPFWLGALLAIGFLNREFVLYVVPVLVAGQLWAGTLFQMNTLRVWMFSLVAFLAVWQGAQALVPLADVMGPGTRGAQVSATRGSQLENLSQRANVEVRGVPARAVRVLTTGVAGLLGGRRLPDRPQGRDWIGYLLGVIVVAAVARLSVIARRRISTSAPVFGWYLLGVGLVSALAYAVTRPGEELIWRYILLTLFVPVGLVALWLTMEPNRRIRHAVVAAVLAWAAVSGIDNWKNFARYSSGAVADPMPGLVTALDARGIVVAEAPYWRAYKLTFLMGERVKVASTDVVRITEYQRLARETPGLVRIQEDSCEGGQQVNGWYLCEVNNK